MKELHSWKVDIRQAIEIQESLKGKIILKKTFSEVRTIGGADVGYSKERNLLLGAVAVLSFPGIRVLEIETVPAEVSFPYVPGLLSFREGPVLIKAFQRLKARPDVMLYDGHGIFHPRGFGLASHLGLWLDIPSIGCAKTPLPADFRPPGVERGSFELIRMGGREVGAILRSRENVKPLFVSPGHRIDLSASIQFVLASCRRFRVPEPLRAAHQASRILR